MRPGVILDPADIRALIAEKYGVKTENVLKIQYSYIVVQDEKTQKAEEAE